MHARGGESMDWQAERGAPRRRLPVKMVDLIDAFSEASAWDAYMYLDLETGAVVAISSESSEELEALSAELAPPSPDQDEYHSAFAVALKRRNLPTWMQEQILAAYQVERSLGTRFIELPTADSSEGYEYMQDFIRTVRAKQLQDRLWDVIRGRGAFRRFKDALAEHPKELERWFAFKEGRTRERALEWLAERGIEPIDSR